MLDSLYVANATCQWVPYPGYSYDCKESCRVRSDRWTRMTQFSLKQSLIFTKWQNRHHGEFDDIQLQKPP